MASTGRLTDFTTLTRRHGIKVVSDVSVEVCSLAVGEIVGHGNIASAARMNRAIVIFLKGIDLANKLVQSGVVIDGSFCAIMPLALPSKKVVISNVPPFLADNLLERELSRYGKVVSKITKLPLGCKSPLLKHVVSFRRQVYMILNNNADDLELTLKFKIDGSDYVVFVTSDTAMKCFVCSEMGHLARACPQGPGGKAGNAEPSTPVVAGPPAEVSQQTESVTPVSDTPDAAETARVDQPNRPTTGHSEPAVGSVPAQEEHIDTSPSTSHIEKEAYGPDPVDISSNGDQAESTVMELESRELEPPLTPASASSGRTNVSRSSHARSRSKTTTADQMTESDTDAQGSSVVFKPPSNPKRRNSSVDTVKPNAKKQALVGISSNADSDSEREGYSSDSSSFSCASYSPPPNHVVMYTADYICNFLKETKGRRDVNFDKYFVDMNQFIQDVAHHRQEGAFEDREIWRLNKIVGKVRRRLSPE